MSPAAMIILRIFHIIAGSFMVGVALFNALFLLPMAQEGGPAAGQFAGKVLGPKFQRGIGIAAMTVFLSGLIMMYSVSMHFTGAWFGSKFGIAITTGMLFAILAMGAGQGIVGKAAMRLHEIGTSLKGPPSPEQQAEMAQLQARMRLGVRLVATFLVITAASMAMARYL